MPLVDRRFSRTLRLLVILLSAQFLLGMWVNLFGTFPTTKSVGAALRYGGDPVLTAHYGLAVLIALLAVVAVVVVPRPASGVLWGMVMGGLVSIGWATLSGIELVLSGFSNDLASFSMAVAFIAATTFYGLAQAFALRSAARAAAAPGHR